MWYQIKEVYSSLLQLHEHEVQKILQQKARLSHLEIKHYRQLAIHYLFSSLVQITSQIEFCQQSFVDCFVDSSEIHELEGHIKFFCGFPLAFRENGFRTRPSGHTRNRR